MRTWNITAARICFSHVAKCDPRILYAALPILLAEPIERSTADIKERTTARLLYSSIGSTIGARAMLALPLSGSLLHHKAVATTRVLIKKYSRWARTAYERPPLKNHG